MKRFLVRLSALTGIVVLGLAVIYQAQRTLRDSTVHAENSSDEQSVASTDDELHDAPGDVDQHGDDAATDQKGLFSADLDPQYTAADVKDRRSQGTSNNSATGATYAAADDPRTGWDQAADSNTGEPASRTENSFPDASDVLGSGAASDVVRAQSHPEEMQSSDEPAGDYRATDLREVQSQASDIDDQAHGDEPGRFDVSPATGAHDGRIVAAEADSQFPISPADQIDRYAQGSDRYSDGQPAEAYDPRGAYPAPATLPESKTSLAERIAQGPNGPLSGAASQVGPGSLPPVSGQHPLGSDASDVGTYGDTTYGEGSGRPGSQRLEGLQTPSLSIEKTAPEEVQVGKTAAFELRVRNTGTAAAHEVEVYDLVPKGAQLVETEPRANRGPDGGLVWSLGTLEPGEESILRAHLLPNAEGEIGSVASVHFRADASVKTVATQPQLALEVAAPSEVMIGEQVTYDIKVSNVGSGTATGVVLVQNLPENLEHPAGNELEYDIGTLRPGDEQELQLTLTAVGPGMIENKVSAQADGGLADDRIIELEVIAPGLEVAMQGPKRRFLERQATYTVHVSNPGTAAAKEIELVTHIPPGMKFVKANNYGHYDPETRAVYWLLEELPAQESGQVELVTLPVETGEHKLVIEGAAEQGLSVTDEQTVVVEGVAAILFEVVDVEDPVEVGSETTYEIRVVNQGTKSATNIRIEALVPAAMRAVAAEGPARHTVSDGRVVFDPLPRLAPKADTSYRIRTQAVGPGDVRMRVQLLTDEMSSPVSKEESTQVYADE